MDVGRGQAADFEGKDVKGAVVIGDADLGGLFRQAVVQRGALGVISTSLAGYIANGVTFTPPPVLVTTIGSPCCGSGWARVPRTSGSPPSPE